MKIIPYLSFSGNAREAITFYQEALGGELLGIMRYRDMPDEAVAPEMVDKILHAALQINGCFIYFSDFFEEIREGNQIELSIACDSVEQTERFFGNLKKEARKINTELQDTFWGAYFGSLVDRYGVGWSFNYQREE